MSESNVQIEFPQPMVEELAIGEKYWLIGSNGKAWEAVWNGEKYDTEALASLSCYKTKELADQRAAWNAQQMARLVIPAWFRALGPDVEELINEKWRAFGDVIYDWSEINPARYRSKPRDVVVTVNGREYRWPQTVKEGERAGDRHILTIARHLSPAPEFLVSLHVNSDAFGPYCHHTRAGLIEQLAAIRAAAGVVA